MTTPDTRPTPASPTPDPLTPAPAPAYDPTKPLVDPALVPAHAAEPGDAPAEAPVEDAAPDEEMAALHHVPGHRSINIAVIGAGWAGLAAATALREGGARVTVYEAGQTPGGRARRVETENNASAMPLDNGQHLLLGAYDHTLAMMRRLGRNPDELLYRMPMTMESVDGALRLAAPRWPAPWHALAALLFARGLSWYDRKRALRGMMQLSDRGWKAPPEQTVLQLLRELQQSPDMARLVWEPLCRAAMNTPIEYASAALFARVLRDSLGGGTGAADLLIPRVDLSTLWPDAAAAMVTMRYGSTVQAMDVQPSGVELEIVNRGEVSKARHDAVIVAVPPGIAHRLVETLPDSDRLCAQLNAFRFLPIATLTLRLAGPYRLPAPIMMLREDLSRAHVGQWVFDRGALHGTPPECGEIAIVVSAREMLTTTSRETLVMALTNQIGEQLAQRPGQPAMPPVVASELIVEKRATFAAVPNLERPGLSTPWPRVLLAGDWTDTGYPAVLEGAVRSGLRAAQVLASRLG